MRKIQTKFLNNSIVFDINIQIITKYISGL